MLLNYLDLRQLKELKRQYELRTEKRMGILEAKNRQVRERCMAMLPVCNHRRLIETNISINENYKPPCPADYSYLNISDLADSSIPIRTNWSKARPETPREPTTGRYLTETVWLDHNKLKSVKMLMSFLEARIESPWGISWLDLSFNQVPRIESDLLELKELQILYLHCNCLESLDEIGRLSQLENLKILTMYGNPIEASEDYRLKIIAQFPRLRRLDFSPVTDKERYWAQYYKLIKVEDDASVIEEKIVEKTKHEEDESNEDLEDLEDNEETVITEEGMSEKKGELSLETKLSEEIDLQSDFEEPRHFIIPGESSWWTKEERQTAEELFWKLREEQENYVFDYFIS